MKQVIYVDVLIAVNLFINYFLILATAKFLCLKTVKTRFLLGELLGAIYSLYILFPATSIIISIPVQIIMSASIIAITFEFKNLKSFFKTLMCFYLINFAFSGIMFALWCTFKPKNMQVNNGIVYFNISPIVLVTSTIVTYIILKLINRVMGKHSFGKSSCEVKVLNENKAVVISAIIDTGNSLVEPFSGIPVIVVKQQCIKNVCPKEITDFSINTSYGKTAILKSKFRMIPFKTISGDGLLPAFKPETIIINNGTPKNAYIAICPDKTISENYDAILNSDLIE